LLSKAARRSDIFWVFFGGGGVEKKDVQEWVVVERLDSLNFEG
jgi:hypothetical protein